LLELLVVLSILAIVTALAVRSLDGIEDQRRHEATMKGLEALRDAVLGDPGERADDGSRMLSGFVADLGRLPRTTLSESGREVDLGELWRPSGARFAVRPATEDHGVPPEHADPDVLVPGGWRGPYVRLPLGARALLDGWGFPIASPHDGSPSDADARLRDAADQAIVEPGKEVRIVRVLGADGRRDEGGVQSGYDGDEEIVFAEGDFRAVLEGYVDVDPQLEPKEITVRLYGPTTEGAGPIGVAHVTEGLDAGEKQISFSLPATAGPRMVRAYLHAVGVQAASDAEKRSRVRQVVLRAGENLIQIDLD
jgi:hypothetical protein